MQKKQLAIILVSLLSLAGCGGGGSDGGSTTTMPAAPSVTSPGSGQVANTAPVANAGSAQNVLAGATVTLDASASSDADKDQLTYLWTVASAPAGSRATLSSASTSKPTFTADVAGEYVFTLLVNDGKANSTTSTVKVSAAALNAVPVANAGTPQNVLTGALVTLNASASTDADGDALAYTWSLSAPAGSKAMLSSATGMKPTFVPDVAGSYRATLSVSDGTNVSAPVTTLVTVTAGNAAPVANASPAARAVIGTTVNLNGAASSDANGDPLTYAWTLTSKPAGSTATLSADNTVNPSATVDLEGVYVFSLSVNDGKVSSAPVTTTITAVPRVAAAVGISTTADYGNFCGIAATITTTSSVFGTGTWTISNCRVSGTLNATLQVRVKNNGATPVKLMFVSIRTANATNTFNIGAGQTIDPGAKSDFALPLGMALDVTDAISTLKFETDPDVVVPLKGSLTLP